MSKIEKTNKAIKAIDLIKEMECKPELKYIWGGIPEGSKGLFTGIGKTGKTTFAENLAISLAVGRNEFFGQQLIGEPKKVLFVNIEEDSMLRSRRNKKQISVLNETERKLFEENYLTIPDDFPQYIDSEADWKDLQELIIESDAEVVIIDSLSHLVEGSIEKSSVAREFSKKLRKYITSSKKTTIIIHHNTKANNKPLDIECIAGSRFITQEFEFALGFSNIPNRNGGKYSVMIFNKYMANDETIATLYKINDNGWLENNEIVNSYDLYDPRKESDKRVNDTNKTLLLKYVQSKSGQGSNAILTKEMMEMFVNNEEKTMSKDTLHNNLNKLINDGEIISIKNGEYSLVTKIVEDEKEAS